MREAARAVNYDYANYSAHLFLANSYAQLSDPNLINLRYETPAENEYLLANLLSPVVAGTMSPTISQQEYSPLFDRNRLGVVSSTEYLSRGAWTESGAQFGTYENFGYAVEGFYRTDNGQQVNNDVEQRQLSAERSSMQVHTAGHGLFAGQTVRREQRGFAAILQSNQCESRALA